MPEVSIIIPTKNGESTIKECLTQVLVQKTRRSFEIIVVDSGSTDKTLDLLKAFPVKLFQIRPSEFRHGATRNYGASKAAGEKLLFINQDILPADDNWFESLLQELDHDKKIAGAYSRQLPRPRCYAFVEKEIEDNYPLEPYIMTSEEYKLQGQAGWFGERKKSTFFSTVSAVIRREVWEKYPFDDHILFAEDQAWAKRVLENGYSIAYVTGSNIYHSHNYSFHDWFRIKYISFQTFNEISDKALQRFLLILPNMLYGILLNSLFVIKSNRGINSKSTELFRGIAAELIAAGARLWAGLEWLAKYNYAK